MRISKVCAFTVLELTVAMLLAGLVIGIAYMCFRTITNAHRQFNEDNAEKAELRLLDKLLKQDIASCDVAKATEDGLAISSVKGDVLYTFQPELVTRDQHGLRLDFFKVSITDLKMRFDSAEVIVADIVNLLDFKAVGDNKLLQFRYQKKYSNEQLFNYKSQKTN